MNSTLSEKPTRGRDTGLESLESLEGPNALLTSASVGSVGTAVSNGDTLSLWPMGVVGRLELVLGSSGVTGGCMIVLRS